MKMLPSLKERNRYLVFSILSDKNFKEEDVKKVVWNNCLGFLGELGCGEAGLWFLSDKWNEKKQKGILKVNNKYVEKVRMALSLVNEIEKNKVSINTVGVSGTLNKAEKKFIGG